MIDQADIIVLMQSSFAMTRPWRSRGYASMDYAIAVAAVDDQPLGLDRSGSALLVRQIVGEPLHDGCGTYPFLACQDWSKLKDDLDCLQSKLLTFTTVTDPLSDISEALLGSSFNHFVRPYKDHFIIDLAVGADRFVDPHHRGCARRALKKLQIECCEQPAAHASEWVSLYANLVRRHCIRGRSLMSEKSLREQLSVPGISMFRARHVGTTVGTILCMEMGERAYFHLGAYTDDGYRMNASYALVWSIIHYFSDRGLKVLSIGAGAGATGDQSDGLTSFKRGWASGTRRAYLCASIFDQASYQRLAAERAGNTNAYFPAYRAGEYA